MTSRCFIFSLLLNCLIFENVNSEKLNFEPNAEQQRLLDKDQLASDQYYRKLYDFTDQQNLINAYRSQLKNDELETTHLTLNAKLDGYNKKIASLNTENKNAESLIKKLNKQIAELSSTPASEKKNKSKIEELKKSIKDAQSSIDKGMQTISATKALLNSTKKDIATTKQSIAAMSGVVKDLDKVIKELAALVEDEALKDSLENTTTLAALESIQKKLNQSKEKLQTDRQKAWEQLEKELDAAATPPAVTKPSSNLRVPSIAPEEVNLFVSN